MMVKFLISYSKLCKLNTLYRYFFKCRTLLYLLCGTTLLYFALHNEINGKTTYLKGELFYRYLIFYFDIKESWLQNQKMFCDGRFVGYGSEFARLKGVIFDPMVPDGHFKLVCQNNIPTYNFRTTTNENHLNSWIKKMDFLTEDAVSQMPLHSDKTTLAILRYEYANWYHQMTDIYNAFVLMKLLNIKPDDLDILLVDKNAPGAIDDVWNFLFGNVTFSKTLKTPVKYTNLIWAVLGYNSPINFHALHKLPYLEDFSNFVQKRYEIQFKKVLDCSRVSILFVWRRNYVAHPGNPLGLVKRKIRNENELLESIQAAFAGHQVVGVQLDKYELQEQIQWVTQTDILIGMHGAGLSHILFLPSHAAVLELYPTYWPKLNRHFKAMSRWKGLHYSSWQNINPNNEFGDFSTIIPVHIFMQQVNSLYYKMCGSSPTKYV